MTDKELIRDCIKNGDTSWLDAKFPKEAMDSKFWLNWCDDFMFETEPMLHQMRGFLLSRDREYFAYLMEQGTGKTKLTLDVVAWLYSQGKIDAVLIVAPNGVHKNWINNEIPKHLPAYVQRVMSLWVNDGNKAEQVALDAVVAQHAFNPLRILSMNVESFITKNGWKFVEQFLRTFKVMFIVDEGTIIKTHDAKRTEGILKLSGHAKYRRLLNGSPVTQSPLDVFPQFVFLDETILRSGSYYGFRNRYAVVEMQGQMAYKVKAAVNAVAEKLGTYAWGELVMTSEAGLIEAGQQPLENGRNLDFTIKPAGRNKYLLKWCVGAKEGSELLFFQGNEMYSVVTGYQRLDELQKLIQPHSFRVLKADCLDLPEKVYMKRYVELSENQKKMYRDLKKNLLAEHRGMAVTAEMALTKMMRLQQICGGFITPNAVLDEEGDEGLIGVPIPIDKECPRIAALLEYMETISTKAIIWARFRPEIAMIADAIRAKYGPQSVRELHGGIDADTRQESIRQYEEEDVVRWLVANPAAKGVSRGQTMVRGSYHLQYSNSFSLDDRMQSEDRQHRIGQTNTVTYVDFVAPDTLDEAVLNSLRSKKDLADAVTGDNYTSWI